MILSGVGTSIMSLSNGSLPVLVAIALAVTWWLDDELGHEPVEQPDGSGQTASNEPA